MGLVPSIFKETNGSVLTKFVTEIIPGSAIFGNFSDRKSSLWDCIYDERLPKVSRDSG